MIFETKFAMPLKTIFVRKLKGVVSSPVKSRIITPIIIYRSYCMIL